jgi:hypothetical protein
VLQISRGWGDAVPAFTRPGFFFFCPSTVPQKPSSLARDRRCRTTAHRGGGRSRALVCRPGLFCFLSPAATRITVSTGLNSSFIRHNSANYGPPPLQQQPPREKITSDASGRLRACRILQRHVGQGWRCCRGPRTHVWRRHVNCVGCLRVPAGNCRWAMQSEQRRNTRQLPRRRR